MKLCDYKSEEWKMTFDGLSHYNTMGIFYYRTEIQDGYFWIKEITPISNHQVRTKDIVILPLENLPEITIITVLIAWNFHIKYPWLLEKRNEQEVI